MLGVDIGIVAEGDNRYRFKKKKFFLFFFVIFSCFFPFVLRALAPTMGGGWRMLALVPNVRADGMCVCVYLCVFVCVFVCVWWRPLCIYAYTTPPPLYPLPVVPSTAPGWVIAHIIYTYVIFNPSSIRSSSSSQHLADVVL